MDLDGSVCVVGCSVWVPACCHGRTIHAPLPTHETQHPYHHPYTSPTLQAVFNALKDFGTDVTTGALVIGGDGRYFNPEAIQVRA